MLNGFKRAVVTMLMLSMVLGLFVFTASAEDILLGDVDANQSVTTADARAILRHAVKIENLAESSLLAADVNQDGNITSADARGALRVAVRLDDAVTITTPDEPTEPTLPEDPTEPNIPEKPTEPNIPEEPTVPEEPTEPEAPEEPTEPDIPEEPTVPEEPTEPEVPEEPTEPDIPEEPTRPGEPGDSALVEQMEIEAFSVSGLNDSCYYIIFVTNNSNQLVQIEAEITSYDAQGNATDSSYDHINGLAPGQTSHLSAWFGDQTLAQSFDYTLNVTEEEHYGSIEAVTVEYSQTPDGIVVAATNNGDTDAAFVDACVIFMKDGVPVYMDETYIVNDDSMLPAGETLAAEFYCNIEGGFDEVRIVLDGRVIEPNATPEQPISTELLDIETYACPMYDEYCYYTMYITNNSDQLVKIGANMIAYDAQGNMIGASSDTVYALAPGQTTFVIADFNQWAQVQNIAYTLHVTEEDDYYRSIEAIEFSYSQTADGVLITAANTADEDIVNVQARVVFLKDGKPVYVDSEFLYNADNLSVIPAGETVTVPVYSYADDGFDDVVIALRGQISD